MSTTQEAEQTQASTNLIETCDEVIKVLESAVLARAVPFGSPLMDSIAESRLKLIEAVQSAR